MNNQSEINQLIDHLFRHESGKMIAVLTGLFGSENLILAEDIVQDTLIEAIKIWPYKGIPKNPTAWLYRVAKNKTINAIKREKLQKKYIIETSKLPLKQVDNLVFIDTVFSEERILDSQLRMMFMCCHSSISKDSQIALILKTLCGFSIPEIARGFLSNKESINKKLVRARKKLRENKIAFEAPLKEEIDKRLEAVLEAIYLLFNEGYSASTGEQLIRYELCKEAIRLSEIIASHPDILDKTNVDALLALMQLNASRFKTREDKEGNIITLEQQNRSLWDYHLMEKGFSNLKRSTQSGYISIYHILASISAYHCAAKDFNTTDWNSILALYDKLLLIDKSPIILLNRAIALSKTEGPQKAIIELEKIEEEELIQANYLFYSTKAQFYHQLNHILLARKALKKALSLALLPAEKRLLGMCN